MKRNIDILALRSYILAEKLGSFAKAASNLNCSPAALSFRIKKLEETLGTRLFHRNYHNLKATSTTSVKTSSAWSSPATASTLSTSA